ncbi:MAG: cysteine desulfurase [Candidatus ainarchaeum sp.]|nr:cysteine desulfurase [Candidatus ainarchaeum sp.]
MNVNKIREDFLVLNRKIEGKDLVYLDNAATSLKPKSVIDAITSYYTEHTANIHRGVHTLSQEASEEYELAHKNIAKFVNASEEEVIFTKNATESINLIMYSLLNSNFFKKGDKIVTTIMEHHSNIIPWQYLEKKGLVNLEFVNINKNYEIDEEDFRKKVKGAKLVSISGASNTIATQNDIVRLGKILREENKTAIFGIDGCQTAPHKKIDFKKLNIDYIVFSGHKMLMPTGIGFLIAKKEFLEKNEPFLFGGDMISQVALHSSEWNKLPYKFEAGTPHIASAYGINAAIKYLEKIGLENIEAHEKKLVKLCIDELDGKNGIKIYGPKNDNHGGIILFDSKLNCHDLATLLNDQGIAIRSGMHCAEPLVSSLNKEGLARASFYLYNTEDEVRFFIEKLKDILE